MSIWIFSNQRYVNGYVYYLVCGDVIIGSKIIKMYTLNTCNFCILSQ